MILPFRLMNLQVRNVGRWLLLAPLVLLLGTATPARAAHLDEALLRAAPNVLLYLKSQGYTNVGVLPFKVKKGTRPASYLGAPLATSMPGRLENALIMGQIVRREADAVGIIRDAAGTANKAKIGSYTRSPAAFDKLFKTSYNLGWGGKKVQPDAFLTGVITNIDDRSKTTIRLQLLTPKSRAGKTIKPINIDKPIEVDTDRSLLSDLGYSYALSRSLTRRGVSASRRDIVAVRQVAQQEEGDRKTQDGQSNAINPDNIAGFAFELLYNNKPQTLRKIAGSREDAKSVLYEADPMTTDTSVTMALTRLSEDDKTLGVVLKVNGQSTWKSETDDSARCKKWIYDLKRKGERDIFEGFYMDVDGKNLIPWTVLDAAESANRATEFGEKAGWIEIDVFASGDKQVDSDEDDLKISSRGLARSKQKFNTLKDLQASLRKANNVKVKKSLVTPRAVGGLLVAESEPEEGGAIETGDFPNPIRIGHLAIRYYDPKSGGDDPDDRPPE
jgi:hypothetical protein